MQNFQFRFRSRIFSALTNFCQEELRDYFLTEDTEQLAIILDFVEENLKEMDDAFTTKQLQLFKEYIEYVSRRDSLSKALGEAYTKKGFLGLLPTNEWLNAKGSWLRFKSEYPWERRLEMGFAYKLVVVFAFRNYAVSKLMNQPGFLAWFSKKRLGIDENYWHPCFDFIRTEDVRYIWQDDI